MPPLLFPVPPVFPCRTKGEILTGVILDSIFHPQYDTSLFHIQEQNKDFLRYSKKF
jgi:hypothetical protein